jgi:hypothetical protein
MAELKRGGEGGLEICFVQLVGGEISPGAGLLESGFKSGTDGFIPTEQACDGAVHAGAEDGNYTCGGERGESGGPGWFEERLWPSGELGGQRKDEGELSLEPPGEFGGVEKRRCFPGGVAKVEGTLWAGGKGERAQSQQGFA